MAVEAAAAAAAPAAVAVEPRPVVARRVRDGAAALAAPDGDAPRDAGDAESNATVDAAAGRGVTAAGARVVARAAHLGEARAVRGRVSAAARILSGTAARMACVTVSFPRENLRKISTDPSHHRPLTNASPWRSWRVTAVERGRK